MKNKQTTDNQISTVLNDYDAGKSGAELLEKYGIYGTTIFELKKKYKNVDTDILSELIDLHEENCRLKTMYTDLSLQYQKLKDVLKADF